MGIFQVGVIVFVDIIETDDLMFFVKQNPGGMKTDEARSSCYKNFHDLTRIKGCHVIEKSASMFFLWLWKNLF